ncbi:adhesion G protein-coupled receptor L3-like isoform X2 [Haemaphysalis longicornis]
MFCALLGSVHASPSDVEAVCGQYYMNMPSRHTTDFSRSCILMKVFALEALFLDDGARGAQLLRRSQCDEQVLHEYATLVPKNSTTSDAVAVCEVNLYHSNGSSCVTEQEDSDEVVHCFFREEVSGKESSLRCDNRGSDMSTSPREQVWSRNDFLHTEREVWVNWTGENIGKMNSVNALDSTGSEWNSSCTTLSIVGFKPRFYKRNCSHYYTAICQDNRGSVDYSLYYLHQHFPTSNYSDAAIHVCPKYNKSVLGVPLRYSTLLKLFHYINNITRPELNFHLIWDGSFNQPDEADNCVAIKWYDYSKNTTTMPCSDLFGYTCRRTNPRNLIWPPENENLYCGHLGPTDSRKRLTCVERSYLSYEESVTACARHSMSLLPDGFHTSEYRKLLDDYETHSYPSEVKTYWLKHRKSDWERCFALIGYDRQYTRFPMNCSARLRTICVVRQENHDLCGQCPRNTSCLPCVSENVVEKWVNVMSAKSVQEIVGGLAELDKEVSVAPDIQTMSNRLEHILRNVDTLLVNMSTDEKADATQKLANSAVDLAGKTMQKTKLWAQMDYEQRLDTAAGLVRTVEDFVIKMVAYQDDQFLNINLGSEVLTVQAMQVTSETVEQNIQLGNDSGSRVCLPPNLVARETKNVSVIFSENALVKGLLGCTTCSSENASSESPVLVTPFVTASLVVNGVRVSKMPDRVQLFFPYENPGYRVQPKCSFIKINDLNVSVWSEDGCEVIKATDDTIVCSCDHLTTFSVLMSPTDWTEEKEPKELEWITKIGCGISIVCLIACVVVFTACRHLRGISNTIHRNLCLSLLIAEILLLVGMKKKDTDIVLCTIVAFFLHFLFLSAFGWMALEGCHIIILLWKVFGQRRSYYQRYYFAGYGIPLVIASITLGSRYDSYLAKDDTYCWLPSEKGTRYSFIGPVAAVIALNLGALLLALRKMSQTRLLMDKSTAEKVQNWLRGTFILLPILGITWLLGFLMLASPSMHLTGAYLFTIFNSLQGLGIFVCHVLLNKRTRQVILRTVVSITSTLKTS